MSTANILSSKEAFASAMTAIFTCPESEVESTLLAAYAKDAVVTVNEKRMTWNDFFPYIRGINKSMVSAEINTHYLLQDGNMFAEKHTAIGMGKDGTKTQAEAICMGEVNAEKKIIWMEEVLHFSAGTDTTTINYE